MENKFCIVCEQSVESTTLDKVMQKKKAYQFKDGVRCEKCAKIKVEEMRKKRK